MSDESQGPGWWQASDGKWYPPQPPGAMAPPPPPSSAMSAPPPPEKPQKKRSGCLTVIGAATVLFVLLIIVIAIVAAVGSDSDSTSKTSVLGGDAPAAEYKVGETAKTSDLEFTVHVAKDPQPPPDSFDKPKAGKHFVSVDVEIKNPGSDQQSFSSLLGFHLLDAQNRQYDETLTSLSPGPPEGEIAAGQSIRGFVVFEIPDGTTGLKFRAQGSLTAAGAVWTL